MSGTRSGLGSVFGLIVWLLALVGQSPSRAMAAIEMCIKRAAVFAKDNRAISDAVAILLFVSIAIVLAAVIGAMVLGKAPSGTAPVAELHVYSSSGRVFIDHLGGDAISFADMKIFVYNVSSGELVGKPLTLGAADANNNQGPGAEVLVDTEPEDVFNAGDRIAIDLDPGQYTVRVVFTPLDKLIVENNVYLSG